MKIIKKILTLLCFLLYPIGFLEANNLPPVHPAASFEEQYSKIKKHLGEDTARLLFFWTSGIFGHGKKSLPLGGELHHDFFHYLDHLLTALPQLSAEIIMDTVTHQGTLSECARLKKKHQHRFSTPLLEVRIGHLHQEALQKALNREPKYEIDQLEGLIHALENGLRGNPAIASDVARIWWLHHPNYALNLYSDIDTFVQNAKKLLLAEIFPKARKEDNIIRMDLVQEGISNDLIATFGIKPEAFHKIRSNFVDKQLMDPERKKIAGIYKEKWEALASNKPLEAYKDSIRKACSVLQHDFERLRHTGTSKFMSTNGVCGLSIPIALLNTFGPASQHGAMGFSQELYHAEKPSYNAWGTFMWTPASVLDNNPPLQWLTSYLLDWQIFKKIGYENFLKDLAKEIVRLHESIQKIGSDGVLRKGLQCFQDPSVQHDQHSQGTYDSLKKIFDSIQQDI